MYIYLNLILAICFLGEKACAESANWNGLNAQEKAPLYQIFQFPFGITPSLSNEAKKMVIKFSEEMKNGYTMVSNAKPEGCFLSVEVSHVPWVNPGFRIILLASGGAIYASDDTQLQKALECVRKVMKKGVSNVILMPVPAVITSYPAISVQ